MRSALSRLALALSLFVSSSALAAKVGVLPIQPGAGVDKKLAEALTEAAAGALAKTGVEVITQAQLKALLDLEAQKALAGCSDDACMAQIGEALGADSLVTGSLARVGKSWLVGLRIVEVKSGASRLADRRLKGASLDDVLDVLPAMVGELQAGGTGVGAVSGVGTGVGTGAATGGTVSVVVPAGGARPSSLADVPLPMPEATRKRMKALTDGKVVIAYDPTPDDGFAPFFVSSMTDKTKLYAQRVYGGGREGDVSFDVVFWDPRARAPWQAGFGVKDGKGWLQCGDKKVELSSAAVPKGAVFHGPRWQRRLIAIARTDEGVYFLVDRAREPDDSRDYRLWVGKKGALKPVKIDDALIERDENVFLTAAGKLKVWPGGGAEWTAPAAAPAPLKWLDLEENAGFAYGELGAYEEPLGTACDGYLK